MMRGCQLGLLTCLLSLAAPIRVDAADLKLLTAGAMRAVVLALLPQFERETGHRVAVDNAPAGTLAKRIESGEAFDVAIVTPRIIDDLIQKGRLSGQRIDLAKVGMGVAVREGEPMPDIRTVDAFKKTLLRASSVAYSDPGAGASSGIYFDKLLERLGIAEQVRAKAKLKAGGYVADFVANGEAELAVHQISEIIPVKGVVLVGPLPAEVQNTTTYSAGLSAGTEDMAAAKSLMMFLAGPAAANVLKSRGMEQPAS
jgi:molybdate transport system substrate-binding protein